VSQPRTTVPRPLTWILVLASAASVAGSTLACQQPPPEQSDPQDGIREPGGLRAMDKDRLREAMQRSIDDSKRFQESLAQSIKQLEEGTTPREVLENMDQSTRRTLLSDGVRRFRGREEGPRDGGSVGEAGDGSPGQRADMPHSPPPAPAQSARGQLGPDERERIAKQLREELPDVADALDALRRDNPRMADGMTMRLMPRFREAMDLRERDPALFRLRIEEIRTGVGVLRAIREYRLSKALAESVADKAATVQKTTAQLREAVAAALDQRLAIQEHDSKKLEKRLDQIKREISEQRERKDEAVTKLIERIEDGEMPPALFGDGPHRTGERRSGEGRPAERSPGVDRAPPR